MNPLFRFGQKSRLATTAPIVNTETGKEKVDSDRVKKTINQLVFVQLLIQLSSELISKPVKLSSQRYNSSTIRSGSCYCLGC
jgi:hypothetical protein